MATVDANCPAAELDSEHPLFILYTSGTTGKPKGILHTTGGYLLQAHLTTKWVFDLKDEDIYWCTADIGWVTGHSYVVYGPLSNGATVVDVRRRAEPSRAGPLLGHHRAPPRQHSLHRADRHPRVHQVGRAVAVEARSFAVCVCLGTVGEPINPEAWMWYHQVIGKERCPIVDTWWQTETGAIMISPLPGATPTKPGSATKPFPGIDADVMTREGKPVGANEGGYLVIKQPWPSMLRTI